MLSGITESTVINITIRIEIIISCCVKLYSAVLFMYFKHPSWNHITNRLSSKESTNLFRWFSAVACLKSLSICFFCIRSKESGRSRLEKPWDLPIPKDKWKVEKNKRHFKFDICHGWRKLNPKVFEVSWLVFICNYKLHQIKFH